jgi:hypothetical protein
MNQPAVKWIAALIVPAGISGAWLIARVMSVVGALIFAVQMVVGKLVLMALAATLGAAFASVHAQNEPGVSGWIYTRNGGALIHSEVYNDLNRFGNQLLYLGHAYDDGVRAVLYDPRTQAVITYSLTADSQNPGKDLLKATLSAQNYKPNAPSITQVFVGNFGASMIGSTAGSMFGSMGIGGKPRWGIVEQQN